MTAIRNAMSPEELAAQAETGEPDKGRWSQTDQLIAAVYDRLGLIEYTLICSSLDSKAKRPDAPDPLQRPGMQTRKAKPALSKAKAERLLQLINGGA